jgi:hypothetical protein
MAAITSSELDGFFKEQYVGESIDATPDWALLGDIIGFDREHSPGGDYVRNIIFRRPHGITFGAAATAYTLNDALPIETEDIRLNSKEFVLRTAVAIGLLSRAKDNKQAFSKIMDPVVKTMNDSSYFYREMCLLYGGRHIGATDSTSSDPGAGTTMNIVITAATFAAGLWAQMEGAKLDAYDDPADGGTKRNTGGPITVTSVDIPNRTVAVSGDNTSLTAIYSNRTDTFLKPLGADGVWMKGLSSIVGHTSGTLFGVNASNRTLWRGNSFDNGGVPVGFSTFEKAASKTLPRGGLGKRVVLLGHQSWADMNIDSLAYRYETNKKGGTLDLGVKNYTHTWVGGEITFVLHPMVWPSEAYMFDPDVFTRIGSTDHTWSLPNMPERFFVLAENQNAFQIRCMWDQALFCYDLAPNCLINNITPGTSL